MADLEKFRNETRAWLAANCPPDMRLPFEDEDDRYWGGRNAAFKSDGQRLWFERMAARGWTVPEWPAEYGGGGLSREEARVLRSEMRRLGCRYAQGRLSQYDGRARRDGSNPVYACRGSEVSASALAPYPAASSCVLASTLDVTTSAPAEQRTQFRICFGRQ